MTALTRCMALRTHSIQLTRSRILIQLLSQTYSRSSFITIDFHILSPWQRIASQSKNAMSTVLGFILAANLQLSPSISVNTIEV